MAAASRVLSLSLPSPYAALMDSPVQAGKISCYSLPPPHPPPPVKTEGEGALAVATLVGTWSPILHPRDMSQLLRGFECDARRELRHLTLPGCLFFMSPPDPG